MPGAENAFEDARDSWRAALREHVLAPPDAGFSARLAGLAAAAAQRAAACEAAYEDGFEWQSARGGGQPPYELRPASGRRGPVKRWERFDEAVAELDRVSEGRSLPAVARATTSSARSPGSWQRLSSARTAPAGPLPPVRVRPAKSSRPD